MPPACVALVWKNVMLTTPRLILRPFHDSDAPHFYRLNTDPKVMKYTGDIPFQSEAAALRFIRNYDTYTRYGYGRWTVLLTENQEYIGWCGLKYSPEKDETDIGFRLMREHWNKGYATEAARACLAYGFGDLQLKKIVGRAMCDNHASIRVLEKIGMTFDHYFEENGAKWVQYRVSSNELYEKYL